MPRLIVSTELATTVQTIDNLDDLRVWTASIIEEAKRTNADNSRIVFIYDPKD